MRNRIRSRLPLVFALFAALGLSSVAAANGVQVVTFILVAPPMVIAGQPICGYVSSPATPLNISGTDSLGGQLVGSPISSSADPTNFVFPTCEPMAGTFATINASDTFGNSGSATVAIL